jgi:hypothetical protein
VFVSGLPDHGRKVDLGGLQVPFPGTDAGHLKQHRRAPQVRVEQAFQQFECTSPAGTPPDMSRAPVESNSSRALIGVIGLRSSWAAIARKSSCAQLGF